MTRFLSVTLEVPYTGISDAGGEFVRRHYEVLAAHGDLRVIARNTPRNITAASAPSPAGLDVQILPKSIWSAALLRPLRVLRNAVRGLALGPEFGRPLIRALREAELDEIDVIEFHWLEAGQWASVVRKLAPHARLVLIAHDVLSQRRRREYEAARGAIQRTVRWLRWASAVGAERRIFPRFDAVAVLSDKDADLVTSVSPAARSFVLRPWLTPADQVAPPPARSASTTAPVALFTGAMGRPENDDAALWLLDRIWPRVVAEVPDATLIIAGAHPTIALRDAAKDEPTVIVTGFVDDLDAFYLRADVFACALRFGAGVKFKTIAAQLAGLPIVSTTVGAEGVGGEFVGTTDDEAEFARLLISAFTTRVHWTARARTAQLSAWVRFGHDEYDRAVLDLIGQPRIASITTEQHPLPISPEEDA